MGRKVSGDAGGINIANSLRANYVFPTAALLEFPDTCGYTEYSSDRQSPNETANHSFGLEETDQAWRIDGAHFGVLYHVIPQRWGPLAPYRIDLRIPDQTEWPSDCWDRLDARDSVHMSRERIRKLGIARHLVKVRNDFLTMIDTPTTSLSQSSALTHCEDVDPHFRKRYESLPFGSSLRFSSVEGNPTKMEIMFHPNNDLAARMLSRKRLQPLWGYSDTKMPPGIHFRKLTFKRQLAGAVSLVSLPYSLGGRDMIFKSQNATPAVVYHELKVLLSLPPMRGIVKSPQFLVTAGPLENESGVCGFLLPYYELGDLDRGLPQMRLSNELELTQQIQWAKDLTSALQHILSNGFFYSDLRMDNVLLEKGIDGTRSAVLTDFQQSRNIYNWAPPEIYYVEWIADLGAQGCMRSGKGTGEDDEPYMNLLQRYLRSRKHLEPIFGPPREYNNPPQGWYFPWTSSTPIEREAGMVYLLGKALWCIFEGMGDADIVLGRSNPYEAEQRFPEFRRTPVPLQSLIKNCTAGAREFIDGPIKIYRRGGKIYPLHRTGIEDEPLATPDETKRAIKSFWENEIEKAEAFVIARMKYWLGDASAEDKDQWLHYLRRPTLVKVMESLTEFERSGMLQR